MNVFRENMRAAARDISETLHKQNGRRTQTLSGRRVKRKKKVAVLLGGFQVFGPGSCLIRQLEKSLIENAFWPRRGWGGAPDDKHATHKNNFQMADLFFFSNKALC